MLWMLAWPGVLCGRRGASTCCGAIVLTPPVGAAAAAAAATGATPPVTGAPPLTAVVACISPAPLAAPGETCGDPVCAALWITVCGDSALIGAAAALALTGGCAVASTALLLLPLMVKVAGCIDGLMAGVPPGAVTKDAWITVPEVEGAFASPFATPGPLLTTGTVTLTVAGTLAGSLDDAGVLSERGSIASPPSKVCAVDVPSLTS